MTATFEFPYHELFRSVEDVWILWGVSIVLLAFLGRILFRNLSESLTKESWRHLLRRFLQEERGAAYSLSFVLVLPFYVLLVALILETTFTLNAKLGSVYAAFAAARASVVWTTVYEENPHAELPVPESEAIANAETMAHKSAVIALTPFAGGVKTASPGGKAERFAAEYARAFENYSNVGIKDRVSDGYIKRKFLWAWKNTKITLDYDEEQENPWEKEITCTLTYASPFSIPLIGRLLGGKSDGNEIVRDVVSTARLPNEAPRNRTGSLPINYMPAVD